MKTCPIHQTFLSACHTKRDGTIHGCRICRREQDQKRRREDKKQPGLHRVLEQWLMGVGT